MNSNEKNTNVKVVVKFGEERKINPIEIKLFEIKLNIKENVSLDIQEYYSNQNIKMKENAIIKQIEFNVKAEIKNNNKDIKDIYLNDPIYNNKFFLTSKKKYLINDSSINEVFQFIKNENTTIQSENSNSRFEEILKNEILGNIEKDQSNDHIFEILKNIIDEQNKDMFFFPFDIEISNNNNKIKCLYIKELNINKPNLNSIIIRDAFYKAIDMKINTKKINDEKTLIIINLKVNKNVIWSINNKIVQFDIFFDEKNPEICCLGLHKFSINNKIEKNEPDNIFCCKFTFITKLNGRFEVNKIGAKLYKKNEEKTDNEIYIINHITKPTSILIE